MRFPQNACNTALGQRCWETSNSVGLVAGSLWGWTRGAAGGLGTTLCPSSAETTSCPEFLWEPRWLLRGVSVPLNHASVHRGFPQLLELCAVMQLVSHAQISHGGDLFWSAESPA